MNIKRSSRRSMMTNSKKKGRRSSRNWPSLWLKRLLRSLLLVLVSSSRRKSAKSWWKISSTTRRIQSIKLLLSVWRQETRTWLSFSSWSSKIRSLARAIIIRLRTLRLSFRLRKKTTKNSTLKISKRRRKVLVRKRRNAPPYSNQRRTNSSKTWCKLSHLSNLKRLSNFPPKTIARSKIKRVNLAGTLRMSCLGPEAKWPLLMTLITSMTLNRFLRNKLSPKKRRSCLISWKLGRLRLLNKWTKTISNARKR